MNITAISQKDVRLELRSGERAISAIVSLYLYRLLGEDRIMQQRAPWMHPRCKWQEKMKEYISIRTNSQVKQAPKCASFNSVLRSLILRVASALWKVSCLPCILSLYIPTRRSYGYGVCFCLSAERRRNYLN